MKTIQKTIRLSERAVEALLDKRTQMEVLENRTVTLSEITSKAIIAYNTQESKK
jgi:hypothetical protein